ncbi:hypothetical protein BpHYR1_016845, partial [Brachionus plicatilis]
ANLYGIPRHILVNHLIGRYKSTDVGRPTVYSTQEEEVISHKLQKMADWRYAFNKDGLKEIVEWVKRVKILFLGLNFGVIVYNFRCNRVNRFNPFGPHIINRGPNGVIQKFWENWVNIFEVFEQNGCEIINKKKYGHPIEFQFDLDTKISICVQKANSISSLFITDLRMTQ